MPEQTQTSDDVQIPDTPPAHRVTVEIYKDGDQHIATGFKEDCAIGVGDSNAKAVAAYAEAVNSDEEVLHYE